MEYILAQFQGHIVAVRLAGGRVLRGVLVIGGISNRLENLDTGEVSEFDADEVVWVED
jgi:Ni,Fe-hydrogenase III large subunit